MKEEKLENNKEFNYSENIFKLFTQLLTGWTTVAFIFLFLFYAPIKETINSISIKLKSANEIKMGGLTIKEAIVKEAEKVGYKDFSKTIPFLSKEALELLLKISKGSTNLWRYSPALHEKNKYRALWLPEDDFLKIINELAETNMIIIRKKSGNNVETINITQVKKEIDIILKNYKGKVLDEKHEGLYVYVFDKPVLSTDISGLGYVLTDKGEQVKKVIINAVINELKDDK